MTTSSSDFNKAISVGRPPNIQQLFPNSRALLVSGIGESPRRVLTRNNIELFEIEGMIDTAVRAVFEGGSLNHMLKRTSNGCAGGYTGGGGGCG